MIRIVADTNVYVSAVVFGGTCEQILALARSGLITLYISPALNAELERVLLKGFEWTDRQVREALAEITAITSLVRPTVVLGGILRDEDDHRVLECALAADAAFVVTGDKQDLLPLKDFRGIRIISPRHFLDLIRA
jgi:putative PIN family toxin of toxin-antitoxin system